MLRNLVEYYEELYPVADSQKSFYKRILSQYGMPAHVLGVSCATGTFEHYLARQGCDVTGIDSEKEFVEHANRKRRTQLMSLRFFQMSGLEMSRFLHKGFYHVISSLNDRMIFIYDRIFIKRFLADCKSLLAEGGTLVLQLPNFEFYNGYSEFSFPDRESIRAKLYTDIRVNEKDEAFLTQEVETGNERILTIFNDKKIYPLMPAEIRQFAKEAGFTRLDMYADFDEHPVTDESDGLICVLA